VEGGITGGGTALSKLVRIKVHPSVGQQQKPQGGKTLPEKRGRKVILYGQTTCELGEINFLVRREGSRWELEGGGGGGEKKNRKRHQRQQRERRLQSGVDLFV